MSVPVIQTAFVTGEVAPALFGHVDLARLHAAASTMRNMYVGFRGGAYSRPGTRFVGFSRQTGRGAPPRTITFQFSVNQGVMLEFGNFYMRVVVDGAFVTDVTNTIVGISQGSPGVLTTTGDPYATGDWTNFAGVNGMPALDGATAVLTRTGAGVYNLFDVYGNPIDTTTIGPFLGGGTTSRIYTLATIYAEADLQWLKVTQSADVMSICCVNQATRVEYPPQDLSRIADDNWSFAVVAPGPAIGAPTNATATASTTVGATSPTAFGYVVTAVDLAGDESNASNIAQVNNSIDIAEAFGSITLTWTGVAGAETYNIYKAPPTRNSPKVAVPGGSLYGIIGTSYGLNFVDSNIVQDLSRVPPVFNDPFARRAIIGVTITSVGSGITSVLTFAITTATGAGFAGYASLYNGGSGAGTLGAFVITNGGHDYAPGDTITFTVDTGVAPTGVLVLGPASGTWPGTVTYFQQRRAYGYTLNNPDTYFMSQPGLFTNFDSRIPTIDTDAVIGSPWAQQVNGIQFMIPTAAGLLVFTGLQTWLLVGQGSFATNVQAFTPSAQVSLPQPEIGCSPIIQPIKINYDVLFFDSNSVIWYDQPYQLYALSEPIDLTQNAPHLFLTYTFVTDAWCRQPYKLGWAVRNDGIMVSLTFDKQQQVAGMARHDTNGLFVSCTSVVEPPVDALYVATQRFVPGQSPYMIERMDDRFWVDVESAWCVDCGLTLTQPTPNAIVIPNTPTGLGAVTGVTGLIGGAGYAAATTATVIDAPMVPNGPPGPGSGAIPVLTIVAGVITAVTFPGGQHGTGYLNPQLVFTDPTNPNLDGGAGAHCTLDNTAVLQATAGVFSGGNVGSVFRGGGAIATVTAFTDSRHVTIQIMSPFVNLVPNVSPAAVLPILPGNWTMTVPVTQINGLQHLAGVTVTGLADGNVITPRVVDSLGRVTLDTAASAVTIGLGFTAQLQSVYLDAGAPTIQGQRGKVAAVTLRMESSRGMKVGSNQPDGSTQNPVQIAPPWTGLAVVPDDGPSWPLRPYNALAAPLRTGDIRVTVEGGFTTSKQVAVQQDQPLPLNVLALIPDFSPGDSTQTTWPKRETSAREG